MVNISGAVNERLSRGTVAPGFETVRNELDALLLADPTYSAQLCVYRDDQVVVDLVGGADLDETSVTGVFSVSKGVAAVTLATLIDSGALDLDERVAAYWPEFAQQGKEAVTVRQLLSHQAGVVGVLDGELDLEDLLDSRRGAERLAAQPPVWRPGTAVGYHALTIGVFMEELVRRITGRRLQELYETEIRAPRDIDFYLGFPESEEGRFRTVLPMSPTPAQAAEMATRLISPDGIASLSFNSINRDSNPGQGNRGPNQREVRAAGPAALGGVGSARGLARLYAAALGHIGEPILDAETIRRISEQQSWGHDRVLDLQMCFGVVFMKPQPRMEFGSYQAFGHDGAGGGIGFADPMYGIGFGYIPMPMSYPGGADARGVALSQTVRKCVARLA